jgi:hypoxanthine phosphoribosyltransferase
MDAANLVNQSGKMYFTYDQIHEQINSLAKHAKEFHPDYIVAIGGGGLIPARLLRNHIDVPILVVTVVSYSGEQQGTIKKIQWVDDSLITNKRILIVDEINDTGATLEYCVNELNKSCPARIAVAMLHHKEKAKICTLDSHIEYFIGKRVPDRWIVYPWDL